MEGEDEEEDHGVFESHSMGLPQVVNHDSARSFPVGMPQPQDEETDRTLPEDMDVSGSILDADSSEMTDTLYIDALRESKKRSNSNVSRDSQE